MTQIEQDRRAEYNDVSWQQGCLLMTRDVKRQSPEWQAEAAAAEKRMVFAHFSTMDDGRSRVLLFACATPEEAAEMVRTHNAEVYERLRSQGFRDIVRHRRLLNHD